MALKAKVTVAFKGVKDGELHPVAFAPGDTVEGNLATVAVEEGWATAITEPKPRSAAPDKSPAKPE